jgi:hypothetical protein
MWFSEKTKIISLSSITQSVFAMDTKCAFNKYYLDELLLQIMQSMDQKIRMLWPFSTIVYKTGHLKWINKFIHC